MNLCQVGSLASNKCQLGRHYTTSLCKIKYLNQYSYQYLKILFDKSVTKYQILILF